MYPIPDDFEYEYRGCDLLYGRGRADELGDYLGDRGLDRALVVCGSSVGSNDSLMDPLKRGLGDRLAGVFDETTPAKTAATGYDGIERMREVEADVLVGVGGGSSLDVARAMSTLAADGRSLEELRTAAREGELDDPRVAEPAIPVVVVPTTLAGADVSSGGSLEVLSPDESPADQPITIGASAMPSGVLADPALVETSPVSVLEGSAMNGFDKGIETPYARDADPFSTAPAVHGLRYLRDALPRLSGDDPDAIDRAVLGLLLVQFERKTSIIHAFGHGFARRYPVQQGRVHAVVAPHVLEYLFDEVDGARRLLAAGLGVEDEPSGADAESADSAIADAVVDAVTNVRDGLDVPTRARDLPEASEADLPTIAEFIQNDHAMARAPVTPTVEEIEAVLREAW